MVSISADLHLKYMVYTTSADISVQARSLTITRSEIYRWIGECVCVLIQQHAVSAGISLLRCGEAQKQLGEAEKKFVQSTDIHFLTPLRSFSDGEYKALQVHTCASITAMFTTFFVSRLFHIVFRSFTGRAQDVVEQTLGLGHRSFQTEKSP